MEQDGLIQNGTRDVAMDMSKISLVDQDDDSSSNENGMQQQSTHELCCSPCPSTNLAFTFRFILAD